MHYDDYIADALLASYATALDQRARSLGKTTTLSVADLRDVIYRSGGRCGWCGVALVGQAFEIDHILPLSGGGAHHPSNLALACAACNRRKGAQHPARFAQTLAAEGRRGALVVRVLADYGLEAMQQRGLFDAPSEAKPPSADVSLDDDEPPPYRW